MKWMKIGQLCVWKPRPVQRCIRMWIYSWQVYLWAAADDSGSRAGLRSLLETNQHSHDKR